MCSSRPPGRGALRLLEVVGELVAVGGGRLPVVPLLVGGVRRERERLVVVQDRLHRLVRVEQLVAVLPELWW